MDLPTKLSRYAEGILEAAWLAAVMLIPVFFNIYSSRIFEPDKITLLRTLALVTLAAWLVKLFEEGGVHWKRLSNEEGWFKSLIRIPLIPVVIALLLVYLVSTVFSITPFTSLWGSYQRLQGTYTTVSYLVIFASLLLNLRRKVQVERLITVAILSSLPVSLYGILQRYHADPIPWGGDVSGRIAANLGNSIFVAAYLIMVFPPTLLRAIKSFEAMLVDRGQIGPNFARSTAYIFILALQSIAIYFSGSRGPWLGWGASMIVVWLGLSLVWRKRWLTVSGVVLAMLAGGFLVTLNIPNGPLESLRSRPQFGRLGQLLDAESRTGKVRTLIWQGASELVLPHAPLEYPDGRKDPFNIIRPLIGYGPESMYVAYNPFYPPELTLVEKRNASPDRSHNETWDSLVITGVLGLIVYLTLFGSLLYFGLKWLGLVPGRKERNLYLLLYLLGGALSTLFFVWFGGLKYLGVALPFGMVLGVAFYMILISLFGRVQESVSETSRLRAYVLLGLLAAVTAHFVEINFGIAIAATRIYFWVYAALLVLVGYVFPLHQESFGEPAAVELPLPSGEESPAQARRDKYNSSSPGRRKGASRRSTSRGEGVKFPDWLRLALIVGLLMTLLGATLGFEYISNASRAPSAGGLISASLTQPAREGTRNGVLPLLLTTWLIGIVLLSSEGAAESGKAVLPRSTDWLKAMLLGAAVSLGLTFFFWYWDAAGLASLSRKSARTIQDILSQVRDSESLLTSFYIQVFLVVFSLAFFIPESWPAAQTRNSAISILVAVGTLVVAFAFVSYSNLRVIQADIAFKTGDLFARPDSWPVSISIYNRANDLAPNEDYYYLFLGRAYLEYAKTLTDPNERERLISQAASDLRKAQEINPLNTDHTANLARLYSLWSTFSQDPTQQRERALTSEDYFARAVRLSPNSARLWDEWGVLYLNILDDPQQAKDRFDAALALDPYYDWTYALLGDYYSKEVVSALADQPDKREEALRQAADDYQQALDLGEGSAAPLMMYNYAIALAGVHAQLGQFNEAVQSYERALSIQPDPAVNWRVKLALAQLVARMGDTARALDYARAALSAAPADQQITIQDLIAQLGG